MKLPIVKAFVASFAYVTVRVGDILRANWLGVLLLHGAMIVLMPRYLEPMIEAQSIDPNADPTAILSAMGPALQWLALIVPRDGDHLSNANCRVICVRFCAAKHQRFHSISTLEWMSCAFS